MTESAYDHLHKGFSPKALPTATVRRRIDDAAMDAVEGYAGLWHKYINPPLRNGTWHAAALPGGRGVADVVRHIDRAIDTSTINRGGRVYRGLSIDEASFQQMLQRGRWAEPGYMSTSTSPQAALSFVPVIGDGRRKVVFVIDVVPGQRGLPVGRFTGQTNEAEILLARNSEVAGIRDVRIAPDGTAVVYGRLHQAAR